MEWIQIIAIIVSAIFSADIIKRWFFKSEREKAETEVDTDKFHLFKELIELNAQLNIALSQINLSLVDDRRKAEERADKLEEKIEECLKKITEAYANEGELTEKLAEVTKQKEYFKLWHCRRPNCTDGRIPPNEIIKNQIFDNRQAGLPE